jgi:hypothetical protein
MISDTEHLHGLREFPNPMLAKSVVLIGSQMFQLRDKDLALLAECAGHQRDLHAVRRVLGHRGSRTDGLVIGMGMNKEQAAIGNSHDVRLLAPPLTARRRGFSGTIGR